ncbi:MAG: hypothetical protein J1E16_02705 [Muribaculaceae bacterium]|nr:hypothetical protein [Muribaculaceae bacterium]
MGIESSSPQINALRLEVENKFGKKCEVPADFIALGDRIREFLKQNISPSTLERVWNYSTRRQTSLSMHTLNILCEYTGKKDWTTFCKSLNESGIIDSDMVEGEYISVNSLSVGDRIEIGWLPNRKCVIEYLGDNKFVAMDCENSTIRPGDTFHCLEFILHQPVNMDYFQKKGEKSNNNIRYVAGKMNGITTLRKL